jgi:hypothetical protein
MSDDKQNAVQLALTPAPELLSVVQSVVERLAEQLSFAESQRVSLKQGVQQVCRRIMEKPASLRGPELRMELCGFSDRVEIVLEAKGRAREAEEADRVLLNQLLDRVTFEEAGNGLMRVTLVKYHSNKRSES